MAERPSVKDILGLVRAAGPVKSEEAEAAPEPSVADEPSPPAAAAPAPPAPTPESLGRPLTLKEKLAAARDKPVGSAPAASPAAMAPPPAPEEVAPAAPPAPAAPALTPEALGRPLTLKEKLASARAGGATAPAPAGSKPTAKPAGAAPAAAANVASTRALPPLEQMSDPKDLAEALRRAGAAKEKVAKAALAEKSPSKAAAKRVESKVVPPRPSKAAADAGQTATAPGTRTAVAPELATAASRRDFFGDLGWIIAGWAAFAAAMGSFAAMSLRFFFPNVLAEPPSTIKVGIPTDFEMGEVNENWKSEWGFWIVRSNYYDGEDKIYALSTICTHLGCPPAWLAAEQKFKCPCHGSGYYVSGVNFEGPAPRPLERFKITLGDDGQLVVDKAAKFQEELGQWTDPESFFTA